ERRRALDQAGLRRPGLRHIARAAFGHLARLLQTRNDLVELVGGAALGVLAHRDRRGRFLAAALSRLFLFFGTSSFGPNDIAPPRRAREVCGGPRELRVEEYASLFVLVLRVDGRGDRGFALRDRRVQRSRLERHAIQLGGRQGDLLAEPLRLAARFENAARVL